MKVHIFYSFMILLLAGQVRGNTTSATVISVKGNVEVRRGLAEEWSPLRLGMLIRDIDTILTGEASEVILELEDGRRFRMGSNAVLDVGDLRTILEKELFLYLMSEKIDRVAPLEKKTKIQLGNVSVVHGSRLTKDSLAVASDKQQWFQKEKNGARALFDNDLFTNAIIKMHKLSTQYDSIPDCGELYYYMGKSFEALEKKGQAMDHYQKAIEQCQPETKSDVAWLPEAREALHRLKQE